MPPPISRATLAKTWVHSHEEDTGGAQVFRPESHPFPPARGRDAIALNPDGSLEHAAPGPDDRTRKAAGSWSLDGKKLILQQQGGAKREYAIESVAADKLLLRPL